MSLPRLTIEQLEKLHSTGEIRPARELEIPELGCSILYREPDARTSALIAKASRDEKGNVDGLEFGARMILEGCIEPKLQPHHVEMIVGMGGSTFKKLAEEIIGSKKNGSLKT